MNNQTDIGLKFTNKVQGSNLTKYAEKLERIKKVMKELPKNVEFKTPITGDYTKQLDTIIDKMGTVEKKSKTTSNALNSAFSTAKFSAVIVALRKVVNVMSQLTYKSSSYLESINLYQVAFNGAYEEADRFVNKITEMYGLDESWAVQTVGIFRQLANAMGLAVEQADSLSYLMTQMSIDISSLYNVDTSRASQVLQSALAGQTRPINFSGFTLKNVLKKIVNLCKKGVEVITILLFKQEMAY